jgi:hypothetical protein
MDPSFRKRICYELINKNRLCKAAGFAIRSTMIFPLKSGEATNFDHRFTASVHTRQNPPTDSETINKLKENWIS